MKRVLQNKLLYSSFFKSLRLIRRIEQIFFEIDSHYTTESTVPVVSFKLHLLHASVVLSNSSKSFN